MKNQNLDSRHFLVAAGQPSSARHSFWAALSLAVKWTSGTFFPALELGLAEPRPDPAGAKAQWSGVLQASYRPALRSPCQGWTLTQPLWISSVKWR